MTAIGLLTCVTLVGVLVFRDASPRGSARRIRLVRLTEAALWLLLLAVVLPRLVDLVT